jgi:hypothetical protein
MFFIDDHEATFVSTLLSKIGVAFMSFPSTVASPSTIFEKPVRLHYHRIPIMLVILENQTSIYPQKIG